MFRVISFVYESIRPLNPDQLPEIDQVYTAYQGIVDGKSARIFFDDGEWLWIPSEVSDFPVKPIHIKISLVV